MLANEKYLTVEEAAEKIGLKPWWIHRAIRKNIIPAYRLLNKRLLVLESEIRTAIENSRVGGRP